MHLTINGEAVETPTLDTVADLANWLGLPSIGSAIELNGAVVRKSDYLNTQIKEGDQLEVIRLVGGG
jgi:thiamine biosynthesis protein ThiS